MTKKKGVKCIHDLLHLYVHYIALYSSQLSYCATCDSTLSVSKFQRTV